MVKGRLNRESNPVPGEKPGFTPQHEKADGSFANTGEGNPFPTNDSAVKAELAGIKQTQSDIIAALQATNETLQGTINTQLTGSNVEQDVNILNRIDKFEIVNLFDSVTLAPSENQLDYTTKLGGGASEIWILINVDKNKWGFRSNNGPQNYGTGQVSKPGSVLYGADREKYANSTAEPIRGLWIMSNHNNPDKLSDVYYHRQLGDTNIRVGITNENTEPMTMTVNALKIWRY